MKGSYFRLTQKLLYYRDYSVHWNAVVIDVLARSDILVGQTQMRFRRIKIGNVDFAVYAVFRLATRAKI
jgi:hypothetical protein